MKLQHPFDRLNVVPIKSVVFRDQLNNPATKGEDVVTIAVEFEDGGDCTIVVPDEWHALTQEQREAVTDMGEAPPFSADYRANQP